MTRLHNPVAALALLLVAPFTAQSQTQLKPKSPALSRTPDGHADLQGTWTNATLTPLERRAEFVGKATLSDEEALAFEKRDHRLFEERPDLTPAALARVQEGKAVGAEDSETWERGSTLARVNGLKRTSLIVDPPDGKIPNLTPEAKQRTDARRKNRERLAGVKDLDLSERCLSYTPVPIVPQLYNGNYQIVGSVTGADGNGNVLLVGTRVQGDIMPRPFMAAQGSAEIQTMMQQGYANVGVILDLSNQLDPYTYLGER